MPRNTCVIRVLRAIMTIETDLFFLIVCIASLRVKTNLFPSSNLSPKQRTCAIFIEISESFWRTFQLTQMRVELFV